MNRIGVLFGVRGHAEAGYLLRVAGRGGGEDGEEVELC